MKKIKFLLPLIGPNSGGFDTVFRQIAYLQHVGVGVSIYVEGMLDETITQCINAYYPVGVKTYELLSPYDEDFDVVVGRAGKHLIRCWLKKYMGIRLYFSVKTWNICFPLFLILGVKYRNFMN